MKKLSAILSILVMVGLVQQTAVFADAAKVKKVAKTNFTSKKKHGGATTAPAATTPAPAPAASPAA